MRAPNLPNKEETPQPASANSALTRWGPLALILVLVLGVAYLMTTILTLDNNSPVKMVGGISGILSLIVIIISITFYARGQNVRSTELAFYTAQCSMVWISALFTGRTLSISATMLFIFAIAIRWLLPRKNWRRYLVVGFLVQAIGWGFELANPSWRVVLPAMVIGPWLAGAFAVLIGLIALQEAWFNSIRTRLLATFIALAAVPVLLTAIVTLYITSQNAIANAQTSVSAIAQLRASQIETWVGTLQTYLGSILQDKETLQEVKDIIHQPSETKDKQALLKQKLNELNAFSGYFDELFLINADGAILVSTNETQVGKIVKNKSFFIAGLLGQHTDPPAYDVALGNYSIVFSQPIKENNATIGVIAGRANLNVLNQIMVNRSGFGDTNETYLVGSNYALLTASRFVETQVGEKYIRTEGVEKALAIKTAGNGSYNDYRNVPVFGSYIWLPDLEVVLISEKDQIDALQGSNAALITTVVLIIFSVFLAALVAYLVTRTIANPIAGLVQVAQKIATGNLDVKAQTTSEAELNTLALAFNTMAETLQETLRGLEMRISERTRALSTSATISRRISTILNLQDLVVEVVNQLQAGFHYYHAHIYLLNQEGDLVMAGGTGEAGKTLLARGHKILQGRGLVGKAVAAKENILVPDTKANPTWLPNPLLPNTKAEVAVPIMIGDRVIGVLDVQNDAVGSLTQEDADLIRSIADQVAIAIQNIQQIENTQKMASDLGVVANVGIATATITDTKELLQEVVALTKQSFNLYHAHIYLLNESRDTLVLSAGAGEVGQQMVNEGHHIPLDREQSLVARAARRQIGVVVNDVTQEPGFMPNPYLPDTRSELAVPMVANGQLVGVLDVQSERVNRFSDADVNIQTTLASQVGIALQNARSFERTQKQAEREAMLNQINQRIQSANTVEAAIQMATRELGRALGRKRTIITVNPEKLESGEK